MPIAKGDFFVGRDVFVDYPFEEVMFRWHHKSEKIYLKFYGEAESRKPVPHENNLFNDALLSGDEISETIYLQGKPRQSF